jgi:hypothetical protein
MDPTALSGEISRFEGACAADPVGPEVGDARIKCTVVK